MRAVPILPTLVVAAAVAVMVALGFWQMDRAAWKAELLQDLREARTLPPIDLDAAPLNAARGHPFRRAEVTCVYGPAMPQPQAGRNRQGATGYRYLVPCHPAPHGAPPLLVDIGFARSPDALREVRIAGRFEGTLSSGTGEGPMFLTADRPQPPLEPSAPPSPDEIPDNHMMYAGQWFFFALVAVVIYILALLRRRPKLVDRDPKA
ncbi:MAG: SURF1 family protein [Allosphingosinicella sp.]|uniref:SURF1 family protein n=1 Tax=Allosphingosinicella sp. TaxID=2823234 RepID=UPI00394C2FD6